MIMNRLQQATIRFKILNYVNSFKIVKRNMATSEDVLFHSDKYVGTITLNRPKALNALTLTMVRQIYPVLKQWESEKSIVIIKGAGEKAFCAGGDVRAVVESGLRKERLGNDFFREEYTLNALIGTYAIPYIAMIDGITMGGGVGLSVHGHYRISTERTLFAMPETAIGLFPDVGGSFFLPRLGGKLGLYLGLTGHRLKGVDVCKAGVATHFCESSCLPELETDLAASKNDQDVQKILKKYHRPSTAPFVLETHLKQIDHCFGAPTVEEIIKRLESDGSNWATSTLKNMKKMSPLSMKLTQKQLELGSNMGLTECLQMEYRMAVHALDHKDFYEGVRALLIDKDQNPSWQPSKLENVNAALVDSFFKDLPASEELKL